LSSATAPDGIEVEQHSSRNFQKPPPYEYIWITVGPICIHFRKKYCSPFKNINSTVIAVMHVHSDYEYCISIDHEKIGPYRTRLSNHMRREHAHRHVRIGWTLQLIIEQCVHICWKNSSECCAMKLYIRFEVIYAYVLDCHLFCHSIPPVGILVEYRHTG